MSSPKDWFRRKRGDNDAVPKTRRLDPFDTAALLDLNATGTDTADARLEPLMLSTVVPGDLPRDLSRDRTPSDRELESVGALAASGAQSQFPVPPAIVAEPRGPIPPPPPRIGPTTTESPRTTAGHRDRLPPPPSGTATVPSSTVPAWAAARAADPLRRGGMVPRPIPRPLDPDTDPRAAPPIQPRRTESWRNSLKASVDTPAPSPGSAEGAAAPDNLPSFTLAAPGTGWSQMRAAPGAIGERAAQLREAFTPTRPQRESAQFSGRYRQMQRIIAAVEEERAHLVIYGERGSGKTSLANIVGAAAESAGYLVRRFACSSELSFEDIFRALLRRVPASVMGDRAGAPGRTGITTFEQLLPPGEFGPPELVEVFEKLQNKHAILIVDEYDRVTDEIAKGKLAELIKNMSDASAPVTIILIGVAENVDELLGKHPSLQRTLVTIPLPLMSRREIDGIIVAGERKSGLAFDPTVRQSIVDFAQGLPYHAQLMSLFAARNALRRNSLRVEAEDLSYAILRSIEEAGPGIRTAYDLAVTSQSGGTSFRDVLFAAACARSDEFGVFSVADVVHAAAHTGGTQPTNSLSLQYPLKKLTDPERGAMLRRLVGSDGLRYQFTNQMMRHYVMLRQARERGLV
jgi:hypothetical protein